jgi:hypothetical protein
MIVDDGWYYRNMGPINPDTGLLATTAQKKINWYVAPNATTVSGLKEINIPVNVISTEDMPFFVLYTKFQGPRTVDDGKGTQVNNWGVGRQNAASWYHGRYNFWVPHKSLTKGKYNFRASLEKIVDGVVSVDGTGQYKGSVLGFNNVNMILHTEQSNVAGSTTTFPAIPFLATDEIHLCAVSTNSGPAAGAVEFILSAVNYYCSAGNISYRFNNADVLSKRIKATMAASP